MLAMCKMDYVATIMPDNDSANHSLQNLCPRPKNPVIADFFHSIGCADELGSGVRNLYKYVRLYSGAELVFDEANGPR